MQIPLVFEGKLIEIFLEVCNSSENFDKCVEGVLMDIPLAHHTLKVGCTKIWLFSKSVF